MKKFVTFTLLGTLAILGIAGCSKSTSKPSTPKAEQTTTTTEPQTTTTTEASTDSTKKAFCTQKASEIGDLFGRYAALLPQITTMTEAQAALDTGRSLEATANTWLSYCGDLFPAQASTIRSGTAQFSAALDRLEALLNT